MNEYEKQANDFAKKYGVKLKELSMRVGSMWGENQHRCIFKMRLSRNRKTYTFDFGQSLADGSKTPTMYEVLACLTKYDVGSFEDFCQSYGYDEDSRKAERTYKAVCREYAAVERLFGDCMDELQEIV